VIEPESMYRWLEAGGVRFYAGVPDSLLADFCAFVDDQAPLHVIAANEGNAVALAMGHYLATRELGCVYMQNSGLGNTVNPLTSLADPAIYGVPMLLVVGWRGEPGVEDEPQHVHMGRVTEATFEAIGVGCTLLARDPAEAEPQVAAALAAAARREAPHALLVRRDSFLRYRAAAREERYALDRERAIEHFVRAIPGDALVVSTTGKPSRELFEVRARRGEPHRDFLTVGGMGHASQIALGMSLARRERQVYCLDGDGAVLMHLGALAIIGTRAGGNFKHVVLNNAAHDSVGGQPTVGFEVDLCAVARACGYRSAERASTENELAGAFAALAAAEGPAMLEVRMRRGARADLGRPTMSPQELKRAIMEHARRGGDRRTGPRSS
jgi:phosphonopyruvate decarboxylase